MSDIAIHQLPLAATVDAADVLPLDQADATRGLAIALLDARYRSATVVPFAYGDASPKPLLTVPAGGRVLAVRVIIDSPFDGAGAALSVGDAAGPAGLMPAGANDPAVPGTYAAHPAALYATGTALTLAITPGAGASQGTGLVMLTLG